MFEYIHFDVAWPIYYDIDGTEFEMSTSSKSVVVVMLGNYAFATTLNRRQSSKTVERIHAVAENCEVLGPTGSFADNFVAENHYNIDSFLNFVVAKRSKYRMY